MPSKIDPRIRELAEKRIARGGKGRVVLVLQALLKRGSISTDDLAALGYGHPPRAIADVKDIGIPLAREMVRSERTGRRMAVYKFGDPSKIQQDRIGGRSVLPKTFKIALVQKYGSIDCITGAKLDAGVLQIDHRVPYRIAGDAGLADANVNAYMLLDGSSQRAKSWACEHCPNMLNSKSAAVCETCFWAFPERYMHIATEQIRRTDVVWQGDDVKIHDRLKKEAIRQKITVAELLKELGRQKSKDA